MSLPEPLAQAPRLLLTLEAKPGGILLCQAPMGPPRGHRLRVGLPGTSLLLCCRKTASPPRALPPPGRLCPQLQLQAHERGWLPLSTHSKRHLSAEPSWVGYARGPGPGRSAQLTPGCLFRPRDPLPEDETRGSGVCAPNVLHSTAQAWTAAREESVSINTLSDKREPRGLCSG